MLEAKVPDVRRRFSDYAAYCRWPRVERPVFWETWQQPNAGIEEFYAAPTAPELSKHLGNAVAWIMAHLDTTHGKAILTYAWNENDEGGSRLRAVQGALQNAR